MRQNKFGQMIFDESDVIDLLMQGRTLDSLSGMLVDDSVQLKSWPDIIQDSAYIKLAQDHACTVTEFHRQQQSHWHMPEQYQQLDIAELVLSRCDTQEQLQRCGQELLMYQERGLFDLLRYLKYLVDVMIQHNIVWGVGRGSSVASYVLYKLGVHRIDSMYYNLDIAEFLR
jgi:DNA polymerase III alpha subunit